MIGRSKWTNQIVCFKGSEMIGNIRRKQYRNHRKYPDRTIGDLGVICVGISLQRNIAIFGNWLGLYVSSLTRKIQREIKRIWKIIRSIT
jgi:hypothetical protein